MPINASQDGSGAGLILTNPDGVEFTYALRFQFAASNNEAEYEALISVEVLETKSITGKEVTAVIEEEGPTWMTELMNYLKEGTLPEDEKEPRKIRLKARQYELMEGILYKRSFRTPWPLSGRAGESQVPDRRNGLLHEVDKSKSGGNDYRRTSKEIRMGKYCMPLRYSRRNNLRQRSKSKMMKYYNSRVRGVTFQPGDFVYRSNDASHAVAGGKLGPKWEGPYEVTDAMGNGAYKLRSTDGTVLPRTWNVTNLKRCYL
nr:reverse transcriptase domain-containing protein [Tanacetum cinerariifolium]